MPRRLLIVATAAALLSGCAGHDAAAPAAEEGITGILATLAGKERLEVPVIKAVKQVVGRATIVWGAVPDAKGYQVVSCLADSLKSVETTLATDTTLTIDGLTPSTTYSVKLRARKFTGSAAGESEANNSKYSLCASFVAIEPVATVILSPSNATAWVGETVSYTVTLLDRTGLPLTGRVVAWASSGPGATVDANGVATALVGGNATITATSEGKSASASLTVKEPVATVTVTPATSRVQVGQTVQLTATVRDRFGSVLTDRVVTWATSAASVASVTSGGLVTAVASGSATIGASVEGKSGAAAVSIWQPGWQRLAATGAIPAAITSSAYSASADAIFAAEMPDGGVGSLWKFSLATNTWSRLTSNGWPSGKYRKLIYDETRHRLLTYWDGLGQVYSIPETGGTWSAVGASGNSEEYYEAYAFQNPVSGRLSVFAGYGYGAFRNTLWEWNGTNAWTAMATSGPTPSPRFGSQVNVVVDAAASRAFFAQRWMGATPGMGDDLWLLDLRSYAWRNLIPLDEGASARGGSGMAYDGATHTLYRYGGMTLHGFVITENFVHASPDSPVVAWTSMATWPMTPGPRYLPGLHFDVARRRLVLVSGLSNTGWMSDVWGYALP